MFAAYGAEEKRLFEKEWLRLKRIVQVDPARQYRQAKIPMATVKAMVYRSRAQVKSFEKDFTAEPLWSHAPVLEGGYTERVRNEFLNAVLVPKTYFSIGPDDSCPFQVFQVVHRLSPKLRWVKSSIKESDSWLRGGVRQYLLWRGLAPNVLPDTCEIFTDPTAADVRVVDFFDLCGWRTWRYTLRVWAPAQSDYEGHEACLAQPRLGYDIVARDLMNPVAVFLCVLEAVCRRGWKLQADHEGLLPLTSCHPGSFSRKQMQARCKPYFQCLLGLPDLWARGLRRLPHTALVSFYEAVLASDSPGDLSERTSKDQLEAITDMAGGRRQALLPGMLEDGLVGSGGESEFDVAGGEEVAPRLRALADGPAGSGDEAAKEDDAPLAEDVSSSSSSTSSGYESIGGARPRVEPREYKVGPVRIYLDLFEHAARPSRSHARCKLTCVGYGHEHCSKRRSVSADHCLRFGEVEAAAYCLAWYKLGVSTGSKSEHLALRPTAADVERAVLELQGR